ncbi:hypothetical protein CEE86_14455, partial [Lactobacillus crispatus]
YELCTALCRSWFHISVILTGRKLPLSIRRRLQMCIRDRFKIAESFVRALGANPAARAIVRSIVSRGVGLGVTISAEGVETVIHAIYPSHRSLSAKVRVFIDALVASFDGLQR